MSHILEIPDELYAALKKAAEASGTTPLGWIAAHLHKIEGTGGTQEAQEEGPKTIADPFAGRVGRIRSGGKERLSEACGEKFTDYLDAKRRAGGLCPPVTQDHWLHWWIKTTHTTPAVWSHCRPCQRSRF
jgi:hypothetical protein